MLRIRAEWCLVAGGLLGLLSAFLPPVAEAKPRASAPFEFTDIDLKLLDESNAIDRQYDQRGLVYVSPALEAHLAEIAAPFLPAAPLANVRWRIRILREPLVNAFALPNGSIYVNSGLLALAENDDQVAAVLAHEAAHIAQRHTYLFNRSLRKKTVANAAIGAVLQWSPFGGFWGATLSVLGNTGSVALTATAYGYSRALEDEADDAGIAGLRAAGKDPAQMVRLFAVMNRKLEPEPIPFGWLDHRKTKDRIVRLSRAIGLKGEAAAVSDGAYLARMRPVLLQNIELDLGSRRFRSAIAAAQRLIAARPEDAAAYYWLGEGYRLLGPRKERLDASDLTKSGLAKGYSRMVRQTEDEETARLAQTPEGRAALESSGRKAEDAYRRSAELDAKLPNPQFGLGMIYERQGKSEAAISSYRRYIELEPGDAGPERAQRRILAIESKGASK